ncbi:MAG TPA: hypothetical protein VHI51_11685 [Ktedonobacterales bacterium]|jgi:hypothetical protein|nr:hypothetical protein [Ktedonobacterales bacterium]
MNTLAAGFNRSRFSRFLNSPSGRIFRIVAGAGFIAIGLIAVAAGQLIGIASLAWGVLPLSAGALDICYVSAALGGPLRGKQIRSAY